MQSSKSTEEMEDVVPPSIENFNELIEPNLNGAKVLSHRSRFLTKPGDNYGSTMLGLTVVIQMPNGKIEELEVVAKLPPTNEISWDVFQPQKTCPRENHCYTHLDYELRELQRENGVPEKDIIDVFPKCYGARISLNTNAVLADKDAALLLENLIPKGYKVVDRIRGFDYDHTLVILENLAKFHALPIALRTMKPKVFEAEIRPQFTRFIVGEGLDKSMDRSMKDACIRDVKSTPEINNEIIDKLEKLLIVYEEYMDSKEERPDSLFTTIAHYDFWVNNMLIKYDSNGKPTKVKMVDFQIAQYDSLVHDLIFFLFSSVQSEVLNQKLDDLIKFYYDCFMKTLKQTGFNASAYSYEKFREEIDRYAHIQVHHVLLMLKVLFMRKDTLSTFDEMKPDLFLNPEYLDSNFWDKNKNVVLLMNKKGWIDIPNY